MELDAFVEELQRNYLPTSAGRCPEIYLGEDVTDESSVRSESETLELFLHRKAQEPLEIDVLSGGVNVCEYADPLKEQSVGTPLASNRTRRFPDAGETAGVPGD